MPKIAGSPARNKVSQTPRTPKTMPKKLAAREMSPMEDALPSPLPRKVNTRRNTMAVNASESDQLVKMVRRSARVIAKKAEWDCEDMPPPSPITTTRAMSMKKSTVKKSVRKTLICGDDGENSDATNSPSIMPQSNYVSLFGEQKPIEIEDQSKNMANCTLVNSLPTEASNESIGEKKNGTFDISNENLNNVSGTDLLTDDEKENSPSVSMLGAKLEASKIHSSDSETENLPSVSILGEQLHAPHTKHEKLPIFVEPKAKNTSEIPTPVAAQKKSRSTRKTVVRGEDANVVSDEANATRFKYAFLLKDDQRNTNENASAPDETSPQPAETLNETIGEKKNGTFDISEENVNDVAELLTEDESDAEEKQNLPSVSMLGTKPKKTQSPAIAKSDSENENLPSVSMMASASIRKNKNEQPINKRISIVDLTDSPAIKKNVSNNEVNAKESESIATEKVNDKTFSPVESTVSPKPGTTTWLTLPPAGTNKSKNMKNPSPLKVHTPFKRKSPRTSNGATKKPLTSAKKKCLLSMAKEAIAERASSKQVVFSSPAKDLTRTPNRAISMGIKKTPYKLPTEAQESNENDEPKIITTGPKTPGKMPDFSKMHQKLFANMESLDTAIVRVDERAKELMSSKKLPSVANIVKPVAFGARRALQPQQNTTRLGGGGAVAAAAATTNKLHKVTKTINRDDRRKQMFKPMGKNSDSASGRVARTGILKGVRTNRRFDLMMQSRELANNH